MKTLKEVIEERAGLKKEMVSIHEKASTEKRDMSAEENTKFDQLFDQNTALQEEQRRLEKLSDIKAELQMPAYREDPHGETKEERSAKETSVFRKILNPFFGVEKLNDEERKVYHEMESRVPYHEGKEKRANEPQSVTTTFGGYLVPTILEDILVRELKAYGGAREAAKVITTDGGYPLDYPTIDDTSNKGRLLAINTIVTVTPAIFGKKTFYAYKFSSDEVLIPTELLQDEKVDFNAYVADILAERIGRIEADYYTTGTGSSQPEGCVYGATDSGVNLTSASAITKANIMDLMYSVDPAYRKSPKCAFMFNDSTAKAIFKLSLGTTLDIPIFTGAPGIMGNTQSMADKMFGFPYFINQSMANIGAALKPILFGDFSRFMIRDVAGMRILRLTERYADYDQIAIILLHRTDSRVLTTKALKYLTMGNT
jgi:HK97 family phage major capsid protein